MKYVYRCPKCGRGEQTVYKYAPRCPLKSCNGILMKFSHNYDENKKINSIKKIND